jgi:YD repeat-containing protein
MPLRWSEYRTVLRRNGFHLVRSAKHETWVQYDEAGRVARTTRASHGNVEIADRAFFRSLLKQCGETEVHFNQVLRGR